MSNKDYANLSYLSNPIFFGLSPTTEIFPFFGMKGMTLIYLKFSKTSTYVFGIDFID